MTNGQLESRVHISRYAKRAGGSQEPLCPPHGLCDGGKQGDGELQGLHGQAPPRPAASPLPLLPTLGSSHTSPFLVPQTCHNPFPGSRSASIRFPAPLLLSILQSVAGISPLQESFARLKQCIHYDSMYILSEKLAILCIFSQWV